MPVVSRLSKWASDETTVMKRVEKSLGQVILNRAQMLAPVLTGALKSDGRIEDNPNGGLSVTFGSPKVPYARRRHYENNKNPQTLYYLQRAGESVGQENIKQYVDMNK